MLFDQGRRRQGGGHLCQGIAGAVEFDMGKPFVKAQFGNRLGGKHGRVGLAFRTVPQATESQRRNRQAQGGGVPAFLGGIAGGTGDGDHRHDNGLEWR